MINEKVVNTRLLSTSIPLNGHFNLYLVGSDSDHGGGVGSHSRCRRVQSRDGGTKRSQQTSREVTPTVFIKILHFCTSLFNSLKLIKSSQILLL